MDRVKFIVNGVENSVGSEVSSDLTLLDFIRTEQGLTGTKYMCREGGCGACIVSVTKKPGDPVTAVNSCLVSVTSCNDWNVTTIEHIGGKSTRYHALQKSLAANNGTQCGHCTPGWIMAMYSLLQANPNLKTAEIEKSFASNICRCTGYRPILETFKKFAVDSPAADRIVDIEDLKICEKSSKLCNKSSCDEDEFCVLNLSDLKNDELLAIELKDGKFWYKAKNIAQIFEAMPNNDAYMLVAGNTAKGVYPISGYPIILIDVTDVKELKTTLTDQNLIIGAGHTLTELIQICNEYTDKNGFEYLDKIRAHLELVAHIPVRNLGSIAGNLMIKHQHNEFQSDVFLLLATVDAQMRIIDRQGREKLVSMKEFLDFDMSHKIILNVLLPPQSDEHKLVTYKIMPRAQNAHAIVNAGFKYELDSEGNVKDAIIAFGGIAPTFVRSKLGEKYLIGRNLFTNETLQGAINILKVDLVTEERLPEPSGKYRQKLAIGLFYKSVLSLCPANIVHARYLSGASELRNTRPVSKAEQTVHTDSTKWPLNQPIPKIEALIQCAGEAMYTGDIATSRDEVSAAFVLSTVAKGHIASIDASIALAVPGVIAFYKASDIPGLNSYVLKNRWDLPFAKEIFCSEEVKFYNQEIGLIVANTHDIANRAAKLVNVKYTNIKPPVLDLDIAILQKERVFPIFSELAKDRGLGDVYKTIQGTIKLEGQYHFPMKTIMCYAKPTEFGLDVNPESQWPGHVQGVIWKGLAMDQNKINVITKRLGGAFGIKITDSSQVAVACSLVANKLRRPCRLVLPLSTVTRVKGKRTSNSLNYQVEVDQYGKIQYVNYVASTDFGFAFDELLTLSNPMYSSYFNVYNQDLFDVHGIAVLTDKPSNGSCRGPGSFEAVAFAEFMVERIASELSLDPLQVRLINIDDKRYGDIKPMIESIREDSDYDKRKKAVDWFNLTNRWKKRGLRYAISRFEGRGLIKLFVHMSVFSHDGTVSIIYSAVDMGQGLNTIAVQTAAYLLKIPINKIQIQTNNTNISPNTFATGGSQGSTSVIAGIEKCCKDLLEKLAPIRYTLPDEASWETLITAADKAQVELQVRSFLPSSDNKYDIFGVIASEVEVDVLTGEMQIVRVDLLQDVGRSVNPNIAIGQIEGAFMMGVGYWTCEKLVYDPTSGELLTDRTWTYKVPQALDIPQDFRVYLRKDSVHNVYLGSKAVGEPPITLAVSIPIAMREAITASRLDSGISADTWYDIDGPYTVEKTCLMTETKTEEFMLY